MINEFTAKKLAEVNAFVALSQDIVRRSNPTFSEHASDIATALSRLEVPTISLGEYDEVFTAKVEKTTLKLTRMMELYIGDEWGNPVEVLEWLSFYAGAASAHADLASAALTALGLTTEAETAQTLSDDLWDILSQIKAALTQVGRERATL